MRQKGLVDLFVMKLDLKNYFLGQFLKQLTLKPSDLVFLCNLDTHVKFRAAMANKAIFGTLGETTRLMITMLATVDSLGEKKQGDSQKSTTMMMASKPL